MPHPFELARARRRSALSRIAGPAQGLQTPLAADKKFRVGRPKLAAAAACLFSSKLGV
jgi:hypothetical protein